MKIALILSTILTSLLVNLKIGNAMEENNLERSVIYYSESGKTHSKPVESIVFSVPDSHENSGNINFNSVSFSELSEWSISSPRISWFGGKSMVYAKMHDRVFGFTVWDDVLYVTPSIPGSADAIRSGAQKLRGLAERRTILFPLKLPFQYRFPGYESVGVDNMLRIADIEISDDKIIVVLENRLKSNVPVTINVPEMTLGEVGEEFCCIEAGRARTETGSATPLHDLRPNRRLP